MIHILPQSKRLKVAGFVLTILAAMMLSACGAGDDSETVDETSLGTVEDIATGAIDEPTTGSPASGEDAPGGTPEADGSATPGVNVSSPPITLPTMTPAVTPEAATPASSTDLGDAGETADGVMGDGTGGAVTIPEDVGVDSESSADASPVASPVGAETTVDSCTVTSYPAFTGAEVEQLTMTESALRAGPGTDCDPLSGAVLAGTQVEVLSDPVQREGDDQTTWLAVSIDGNEGWLAANNLEPAGAGQ